MKLIKILKSIPNIIPTKEKLEEMKEWSVQRRAMYWGARVIVIGITAFLTYKGVVSDQDFIELIEGLF
jgi:hypothetical protein